MSPDPIPDATHRTAPPARRGRWHSHQPNVPGRGIVAAYSPRFWVMTLVLGVVSGLAASVFVGLLHLVERIAYGRSHGESFLDAVRATPAWRHVLVLLGAAVIVGLGLRVLGSFSAGSGTEVSEALWLRRGRLDLIPSLARSTLSIVAVGLGVSLGREGAPQLAGAAAASRLSGYAELPMWQRRLLVASGAGAAFAAVYNVPLGGTLLALEVLLGALALPLVLPALLASVTATATAWITLGTRPAYVIPTYAVHDSQLVWAVLMGPVIGLVAVGWVQLIARADRVRPRSGWARYAAPFIAFGILAVLAIPYPQLLGNGKDIVQLAIVGNLSIGLLFVLFALKPMVTVACLTSGCPGGLFTPTFAVGVLFTGALGSAFSHIWHGASPASYSLIGGGAFLAAAMQGPLSGLVLVLELTRNFDSLMVPTLIAVTEATIVARVLGAHSIYSARLPTDPGEEVRPPAAGAASMAALQALDEEPLDPGGAGR
jgi:H+/Cl- antiporter ClcA